VGSELHAAPSAPQHLPFSPSPPVPLPLNTLTRKNSPRGEGAAIERRTTEDRSRPEPLEPPDEDLQESGGASTPGDSPFLPGDHGSPRDLNSLGPACTVTEADAKEVEPSCVDAHKRGGAPLLVGAAPPLAEGAAGVGPAGEAERAVAARPEALAPPTQGKASHEVQTPSHEGKGEPDALPPEGKRKLDASLQGCPNNSKCRSGCEALPREGMHEADEPPPEALPQKGKRNPEALSRKRELECPKALPPDGARERGTMPQGNPNEGALVAWDPGGRLPTGKRAPNPKGPVEAKKNIAQGIDAHNKTTQRASSPATRKIPDVQNKIESVCQHHREEPTTHFYPYSITPSSCCRGVHPLSFRGPSRGHGVVLGGAEQRHCNKDKATRPFGCRHTRVTRRHTRPRAMHTLVCTSREVQRAATAAEYNPCAPPSLFGDISLQCPDCLRNEGECSKWRAERIDKIIYPAPYIP